MINTHSLKSACCLCTMKLLLLLVVNVYMGKLMSLWYLSHIHKTSLKTSILRLLSVEARGIIFSLNLNLLPYCVYASS